MYALLKVNGEEECGEAGDWCLKAKARVKPAGSGEASDKRPKLVLVHRGYHCLIFNVRIYVESIKHLSHYVDSNVTPDICKQIYLNIKQSNEMGISSLILYTLITLLPLGPET